MTNSIKYYILYKLGLITRSHYFVLIRVQRETTFQRHILRIK